MEMNAMVSKNIAVGEVDPTVIFLDLVEERS
jgi:hypothetical protein